MCCTTRTFARPDAGFEKAGDVPYIQMRSSVAFNLPIQGEPDLPPSTGTELWAISANRPAPGSMPLARAHAHPSERSKRIQTLDSLRV